MSRVMRKLTFCISENKDADQLRSIKIMCYAEKQNREDAKPESVGHHQILLQPTEAWSTIKEPKKSKRSFSSLRVELPF